MSRQPYEIETQIREKINQLIETEAIQTNKVTFYPPSYIVKLMDEFGYSVTKDYVIRRYKEIGIKNENGLWVKKI